MARFMRVKQSPVLADLVHQVSLLPAFYQSITAQGTVPIIHDHKMLNQYVKMHKPCVLRSADGEGLIGLERDTWHPEEIVQR